MRWQQLQISETPPVADSQRLDGGLADGDARAAPPLPLALAGGIRRTFDTPAFAGMTFYEVRAKSIINRVPGSSKVPFQWTINPYRGCSHACAYCVSGETAILMGDGRTKPIADVRVGDVVYGTVRRAGQRRYEPTPVLAHWSTVKPAFRVRLGDGTSLVASGDHRFLSDRGWKYVGDGAKWVGDGADRPTLACGDRLVGVGDYLAPCKDTDEYRRGYLCGLVRVRGRFGAYAFPHRVVHRFQMALTDVEALRRARDYLGGFGIETSEFAFPVAPGDSQLTTAIRTQVTGDVEAIRDLVGWPALTQPDWLAGFLAGVFDAAGSYREGVLRVARKDPETLDLIVAALTRFDFRAAVDRDSVRVAGGLGEHLRFFHRVDSAVTRKRAIAGRPIESAARLQIASIESLGLDVPMFDMTTGTGDFIANGVVSHNCFARNTHTYLDLDSGRDFDTQIVVKVNAGELLRRELAAPRWGGGHIAMGTNVDCYQRAEGRYRLMPRILEALRDFANPFSILIKGTLILRDIDLLKQAAEVTTIGLSLSIGFVDETLWRAVEPGTPSPRRRLDAVRQLTDAGFAVGVLMAPILPGLSDTEESIDATVAAIAASGATSVVPLPLHLRTGAREWYLSWLDRMHPELRDFYRQRYGARAYLGAADQREITARVRIAARRHGISTTGARDMRQVDAGGGEEQITAPPTRTDAAAETRRAEAAQTCRAAWPRRPTGTPDIEQLTLL